MPRLVDFLVRLADDPEALANFARDPQRHLRDVPELTDEQRTLLLSRDAERIQHVIEYELGGELPDDVVLGVVLFGVIGVFVSHDTPE